MSTYYLAVDIGASSGRHMLAHMEDGKMVLEEIYRFENGMDRKDGKLLWNTERLFTEIKNGLKKAKELGKVPVSMGIDTWAVDYVLLDKDDKVLGDTFGYRDHRTDGMDEEVYKLISVEDLYARTGIQKQIFNTVYQLMAVKMQTPGLLEEAEAMLMLPDYFHYLLTGVKMQEYTNATSTQLVNAETGDWDYELIDCLGYPRKIFLPISMPGTVVGHFTKEIAEEIGYDCEVVLPATHDTGSAIMALPTTSDDTLYISSGTWSLMGVENKKAVCTPEAQARNFTNEGGYDHRFRFLKNIMGLWMIQQVRHELNDAYSFAQLCDMAEVEKDFPSRVDVNDACFLSPANMQEAIREYLRASCQQEPANIGQMAAVIYQSLAESYAATVKEIEELTGKHYEAINIVGGGSKAMYLNVLTAQKTGRKVIAGPGEGTAIGNLMAQMIRAGVYSDLKDARQNVAASFDIFTVE